MIAERHRRFIQDTLERYKVPPLPEGESAYESLLAWTHTGARSQVEVALRHPIKLLVNALGTPPRDVVDKVHEHGVLVAALIGTAEHARRQVEAGGRIAAGSANQAGGPPARERSPRPA